MVCIFTKCVIYLEEAGNYLSIKLHPAWMYLTETKSCFQNDVQKLWVHVPPWWHEEVPDGLGRYWQRTAFLPWWRADFCKLATVMSSAKDGTASRSHLIPETPSSILPTLLCLVTHHTHNFITIPVNRCRNIKIGFELSEFKFENQRWRRSYQTSESLGLCVRACVRVLVPDYVYRNCFAEGKRSL